MAALDVHHLAWWSPAALVTVAILRHYWMAWRGDLDDHER